MKSVSITEKQFYENFSLLFQPEERTTTFCEWCASFVDHARKKSRYINCRHSNTCWTFGSRDEKKHSGIRKTTLQNDILKYLGKEKQPVAGKTSTKTRSYFLSFFSKYVHQEDKMNVVLSNLNTKEYVIRHLCGCKDCCEPTHLEIGTPNENINDRGVHNVLQEVYIASKVDYGEIISIFKKWDIKLF